MKSVHRYMSVQRMGNHVVAVYSQNRNQVLCMPAVWNQGDLPNVRQVEAWIDGTMSSLRPWFAPPMRVEADTLTKQLTCFESLQDMQDASGGYRPSLHTSEHNDQGDRLALLRLADLYDMAQAARGDERRAYRY